MSEPANILIVDDTEANVEILLEALSGDYEVSVAMDGLSALEAIGENQPDLILLDIMMPEMDGYEVCKRLKEDQSTREIPIIFLTAMTETENKTKGFEVGAVDYITKPFEIAEVKARVRTHLSLKEAREKLEQQNAELQKVSQLREDVERITRHDLKSPLTSIIGMPDLLMMDNNLTGEQIELIEAIKKSGYKMLQMINISLDLFKMERGTYEFQPANVNILKVFKNILVENKAIIQSKGLTTPLVVCDKPAMESDEFILIGEELLCYSLFGNLIKNALEASPENEHVTITIKINKFALIRISNKGSVPTAIRKTFFDKYVTSGKKDGTGLGTYSARLIAKTQEGDIKLDASKENETTIEVKLRLK